MARRITVVLAGSTVALVGLVGCREQPIRFTQPTDEPRASATVDLPIPERQHVTGVYPQPGSCRAVLVAGQYRADRDCTPGAFDPRVTDANVGLTACASGWSRHVRPRVTETRIAERKLIGSYGLSGTNADYSLDHLVSIYGLGGSSNTQNLWPEPKQSSYEKDKDERRLARLVCSSKMRLSVARREIVKKWAR